MGGSSEARQRSALILKVKSSGAGAVSSAVLASLRGGLAGVLGRRGA